MMTGQTFLDECASLTLAHPVLVKINKNTNHGKAADLAKTVNAKQASAYSYQKRYFDLIVTFFVTARK